MQKNLHNPIQSSKLTEYLAMQFRMGRRSHSFANKQKNPNIHPIYTEVKSVQTSQNAVAAHSTGFLKVQKKGRGNSFIQVGDKSKGRGSVGLRKQMRESSVSFYEDLKSKYLLKSKPNDQLWIDMKANELTNSKLIKNGEKVQGEIQVEELHFDLVKTQQNMKRIQKDI